MIPAAATSLNDLAVKLLMEIAPQASSNYSMANSALIGQLLLTYAQEFECAIEHRMQDINALRMLFANCSEQVPAHTARQAFIAKQPASLMLSDVNALHDEGMRNLSTLHAWAEEHAPELNTQIWQFLREHCERHQFQLP